MHQVQHKPNTSTGPCGELASRMLAIPSHTNPMGNIFGGWIMSVMDAAALMTATKIADGTVVTVFVAAKLQKPFPKNDRRQRRRIDYDQTTCPIYSTYPPVQISKASSVADPDAILDFSRFVMSETSHAATSHKSPSSPHGSLSRTDRVARSLVVGLLGPDFGVPPSAHAPIAVNSRSLSDHPGSQPWRGTTLDRVRDQSI